MRFQTFITSFLLILPAALAQNTPQQFTDPVALLQAVAKVYAGGADSFHMESIEESSENTELHREWRKTVRAVWKDSTNRYRIETRSPFGSWIQDSDGLNEWVYFVETKKYVKRPLPEDWPQFPKMMSGASEQIQQAYGMRAWLEGDSSSYKHATMLGQKTITVEGQTFRCYVVHVTSDDDTRRRDKQWRSDTTFWIDKDALVFRKKVEHSDTYLGFTEAVRVPLHQEIITIYPITDLQPKTEPGLFTFTPPIDGKEVATLEPDFHAPPLPHADLTGKMLPDITLTTIDGNSVLLSAYRGKPVLLDLWATWCGPCLLSMPSLGRIYADFKDKGLALVTVDQDNTPQNATDYLARHHYAWTNYHDTGSKVGKALQDKTIPLTVLIDAQGKIVYYGSGGDEAAVRKAIAGLGQNFIFTAIHASVPDQPSRLRTSGAGKTIE